MSDWIDALGYAASSAVLATFCMQSMLPLRCIGVGSNVFSSSTALSAI
jgi:hypothetical protein